MVYSKEDVNNALEAIVRGRATDEAYVVIEQAGWAELVPGVIYKVEDEKKMEITVARKIIEQAKKDEVYGGPMPEDDATALKEAQDLVTMAEQAWSQNVRGPEVEAILNLANGASPNGGKAPEAQTEASGGDDEEQVSGEEVGDLPENLTKIEPWENYGEDRVKDIIEGIDFSLQDAPEDLPDLLNHIKAYELSHKKRVRILNHVAEAMKQIGATNGKREEVPAPDDEPQGPEAQSGGEPAGEHGTSEAAPEAESGEEGSGGVVQEEAEGASQPSEDGRSEVDEQSADAVPDAEPEVDATGDKGGSGEHEAEPPEENQQQRSGEDSGDESPYQRLIGKIEEQLRNERSDIPKPPEEPAPQLPWRWRDISDADLHDYYMQYSVLAYYKSYIYTRDERIAMHCKEAADEIRNQMMLNTEWKDEKRVTIIEARVESSDEVRKWRRLQRKHEQFAQAAKREMESYLKLVESLSRFETMRQNVYARGRK